MATFGSLPPLDPTSRINSGAFGTLYLDPRNPTHCIKVLKTPLAGDEGRALIRLAEVARWARPSDSAQLSTRFAWPLEIFGTNDEVHGYTMPLAPASCFFELTAAKRTRRETLQIKFLTDDSYWRSAAISSAKPSVGYQDRLEIAIDCLDSMDVLHRHGLSYGDISGNNVVARLDERPGVFFFDADSISPLELRAKNPLMSPGWETPDGLDPISIDRSRFSILVIRLLLEEPNVFPDWEAVSRLPNSGKEQFGESLVRCYFAGFEKDFLDLSRLMREAREDWRDSRAIRAAVDAGYARWLLRERSEARSPEEKRLIGLAEAQVGYETQIDEAAGLEYRKLLRRVRALNSGFSLDVRPRVELLKAPTTAEDLHQLVYDAMFVEITSHFSVAGLGPLESDSWMERAVQHAHLEVESTKVELSVRPGEADVSFRWPEAPFVNCARLVIEVGGRRQEHLVRRGQGSDVPLRQIKAPQGCSGQVSVCLGSESPSGRIFYSSVTQQARVWVDPIPTPATSYRPSLLSSGNGLSDVEFVDPIEEERRRLEQERLRRVTRRRNLAISAVVVVLLGVLGKIGYDRYLVDDPLPVESIRLNLALDESMRVGLSVSGGITIDDQIAIFGSNDGKRWTLDKFVNDVLIDGVTVDLGRPATRYIRARYLDGGRLSDVEAVIGAFPTGFSAPPVVIRDGSTYFVQWDPMLSDDHGVVIRYNYKVLRTLRGTPTWLSYFTTRARTSDFALEASEGIPSIRVQAVFADGFVGPMQDAIIQSPELGQ